MRAVAVVVIVVLKLALVLPTLVTVAAGSCEIEDFVETHLHKLRRTLRSRVLRMLLNLVKNISP